MALSPHKITALAESDATGTDGKNIVAGALVSLYDPAGVAVTLYDDENGTNGNTQKTTDATGQVVVYVTPGEYEEEINGGTRRKITVSGDSISSYATTAEVQALRPTKTGLRIENRERANAQYVLAAAGYVAQPGDITAANGRVWALLNAADATIYSQVGGSLADAVASTISKTLWLGDSQISTAGRVEMQSNQTISGNTSSKVTQTTGDIVLLGVNTDGIRLENFEIDGNRLGQLDGGLIQINSSRDFLVQGMTLRNGGDPEDATVRPQGVNGVSVATDSFPGGGKSSGIIRGNNFFNFTKGPINWTTYAEGGVISENNISNCVGNGSCPGIQVNGGRDVAIKNNRVDSTEGAGLIIGAVGTTPPYGAKNVLVSGNTYKNIGSLGLTNNEKHAIFISNSQGADEMQNITISGELAENTAARFLNIFGASEVSVSDCESYGSFIGVALDNATNTKIKNLTLVDFNNQDLTGVGAYFIRNSGNILINGGRVDDALSVNQNYLVSATSGNNTNVVIQGVTCSEGIKLIKNTETAFFTNSEISAYMEFTCPPSSNFDIQLARILDSRRIKMDCECDAIGDGAYSSQRKMAAATASGATAAIESSDTIYDNKTNITTGLFFDTTADNIRLRYLNSSTSELKLRAKLKIKIY